MSRRILNILSILFVLTSCIKEKPTGKDLVVGEIIPDFTVTINDGSIVTGAFLRETPSCVVFFHTSCPDCRQALPVMQEIYEKYLGKGVRFAFISREDEEASVSAYWKEQGFTMPYSAQTTREVYNLFAQTRVPRIYICEKGGVIRNIYTDDPVPGFDEIDVRLSSVCDTDKE